VIPSILRLPAVKARSGYSRSTIYLLISQRLWTKPISLGIRAVGWPETEVEALNAARIAGNGDDEIRCLVQDLEAARKNFGTRSRPPELTQLVERQEATR
jgi:prophage regulatory protein